MAVKTKEKMQYLKVVPLKIQNFQTKQLGGSFLTFMDSVDGILSPLSKLRNSRWHSRWLPVYGKSNYYGNIHVLAYLTPESSAVNTMLGVHLR